jgi:hypothetical protein
MKPPDYIYDVGRWKIYRYDAGMGETDYGILRNGEFFCSTEHEDIARLIIAAMEACKDGTL